MASARHKEDASAVRYMLDTDVCSYIMKRSNPEVLKRLRTLPVSAVCMSIISRAELLYGVQVSPRRSQDAAALAAFLPYVEALDFGDDAARHYAEDPRRPQDPRGADWRQRSVDRGARPGPRPDARDEQHRGVPTSARVVS